VVPGVLEDRNSFRQSKKNIFLGLTWGPIFLEEDVAVGLSNKLLAGDILLVFQVMV
jgi:hypothetical protein